MKKFITRSLFAFVIMGFSLVTVNATTEFTYEGWQAPTGYGTITGEVDSNITNLKGETTAVGGMYVGPFNKQSIQALEDGIIEETHVDLDFEAVETGEFFEVSLALNDANGDYLDEAVVMTQLVEEGKFKLTAGWAPDFEAVVTEDGVYTYQWEAYIENEKAYVKFNLVKNGEVVESTGAIEFTKLNAEGVTVRYLWFCNINVAEGVNVYTKLPTLTIETDTKSDFLTVVDSEKAKVILEKAVRNDGRRKSNV